MSHNDKSAKLPAPRAEDRAGYHFVADAALAQALAGIEAGRAELEACKASRPDLWPTILQKLKIRWTADSNAIEGSSLTFADTLFFLEQGLTVQGKPLKDFLDARNHAEAIEIVLDAVANRRPITQGFLKELNALILSGVRSTPARDQFGNLFNKPAAPGEYKQLPNHVLLPDGTLHTYADPIHVAAEMEALCDFVEHGNGSSPVIRAALAHYNYVRIHPFDDGNGRGARILMNLVLMRAGLPPAVIRNETRADYLAALRQADRGIAAPFVRLVAQAVLETLQSLIDDFRQARPMSR